MAFWVIRRVVNGFAGKYRLHLRARSEDQGGRFLRIFGDHLQDCTVSQLRTTFSST
jgi:hypothetical protein